MDSTAIGSCELYENFKNCRETPVVKSLSSKVTEEISAFYKSVESCVTYIVMFQKRALLEISRNSLQPELRLSTNFIKNVSKILKGFKLHSPALHVFKIPEVTCTVKLLFTEKLLKNS